MYITRSYSQGHRPDLKQAGVELIVSRDGVPCVSTSWHGNPLDIEVFQAKAKARLDAFKNTPSPQQPVTHAKFSCEDYATSLLPLPSGTVGCPWLLGDRLTAIEIVHRAHVEISISYHPQRDVMRRFPCFYGWVVIAVAFVTTVECGVNTCLAFFLPFPLILDRFPWKREMPVAVFSLPYVVAILYTSCIDMLMDSLGLHLIISLGVIFVGLDHGIGHPHGLFHEVKRPKCQSHETLEKLGPYSKTPKVADAVSRV
jgi:hypothetical protein